MTSHDLFHWIIPMIKSETPEMQKNVVFALGKVAFPRTQWCIPFTPPRILDTPGRIPEFPGGAAAGAEGGGGQERDCQTTEAALWNASRVGAYSGDERVPSLLHPVPPPVPPRPDPPPVRVPGEHAHPPPAGGRVRPHADVEVHHQDALRSPGGQALLGDGGARLAGGGLGAPLLRRPQVPLPSRTTFTPLLLVTIHTFKTSNTL